MDARAAHVARGAGSAPSPGESKARTAGALADLAHGRELTRASRWTEAYAAFTAASAELPTDARPVSELGYAHFLAGDLGEAERDFLRAQTLNASPKVAAQISYNLGLVREKQGDKAGARNAFARSLALEPTAAAQAKLGAAGGCAVDTDIGQAVTKVTEVESWTDLVRANGGDMSAVHDEPSAKAFACHGFSTEADAEDACAEAPPWTLHTASSTLSYSWLDIAVVPRPGGKLVVADLGNVHDWPDMCNGARSADVTVDGDLLTAVTTEDGDHSVLYETAAAAKADGRDPSALAARADGSLCADGPGSVTVEIVSMTAHAPLAAFSLPEPAGAKGLPYKWTRTGRTVSITGAGCALSLDLDHPDAGR